MPLKARCHCGATQFEVDAAPESVTICNCSYCYRLGGLWAYYAPEAFRLTTARDRAATYQFGTYTGEHHHCAICGCKTWSESLDWRDYKPGDPFPTARLVGVNARLFDPDELDLKGLPVIEVDGRSGW